jgi:hypothetical protein
MLWRAQPMLRFCRVSEDLNPPIVKPDLPRELVRLVAREILLPRTAMLQRSRRNHDIIDVFEFKARGLEETHHDLNRDPGLHRNEIDVEGVRKR